MNGDSHDTRSVAEASDLFKTVLFQDWWNGVATNEGDSLRRLPLVDVRSADHHDAQRVVSNNGNDSACVSRDNDATNSNTANQCSSVVVHLPFETLLSGERSCELPPRHVEFAVLTDDHDVPRKNVEEFFGATVSKATQQSRKPWRVVQVLVANDDLWHFAEKCGIFEQGTQQHHGGLDNSKGSTKSSSFVPLPRLWQPDPLIQHMLLPLLKGRIQQNPLHNDSNKRKRSEESDTIPGRCLEIWDLGSGAGRDVCFLAEELKKCAVSNFSQGDCRSCETKIVGVDNHKASAKRCIPFWKHRHVDDMTEALYMNLNKIDFVRKEIQDRLIASSNVACYYAVRFWNQKLVNYLASEERSQKGTLFAMSHFCKPYEGAPWNFDHPKEKNVLERTALQEMFETTGRWEILHNEIAPDGDHGRTLIQFVARRT